MNHPATFVLPLAAGRVLDVLHSQFQVGELCAISQDEVAQLGNISEASVSRAMLVLIEHGFIWRSPFDRAMNRGRGGYWIRLLPLPKPEGSIADPGAEGSIADPGADEGESRAVTPRMAFTASPCGMDHPVIPKRPPMVLMTQSQNQEEEIACAPLFVRLIAEPNMNPQLATKIARHPPGTLADFEADLKIAQTMPRISTPFYFTVSKWEQQQRVIAPQESRHERPTAARPATGTRRESPPHRSQRAPDPTPAVDYTALRAEIAAARHYTAEELGLPVPRSWRDAYAT